MLVTIGLYYPWARVRRLRYLHANTWVERIGGPADAGAGQDGGRHALDFHARPWQMFGATMIVGLALLIYSIGSHLSPSLAGLSALLVTALTPLITRAALRFRLANTSWRGLRFGFDGSLADAYRVYWPALIPAVSLVAALLLMAGGAAGSGSGGGKASPVPAAALLVVSAVSGYLVLPWLWLRVARYRHGHFVYGTWRTGFTLAGRDVLRLLLRVAGVSLLTLAVVAALAGDGALLLAGSIPVPARLDGQGAGLPPALALFLVFSIAGLVVAGRLVVLPYIQVQQQNAVWSATRSPDVVFDSRLAFGAMVRVGLVNWVLTLLTLGLYRPFADIAVARLRLEAVSGECREDPAEVIGRERERRGALGDVGADLFDLGGAF